MKFILAALLILIPFTFGNAQQYEFDRKCVIQSFRIKPKIGDENNWKRSLYFNTGTSEYYMLEHNNGSYSIMDNDKSSILDIVVSPATKGIYHTSGTRPVDYSPRESDIKRTIVQRIDDQHVLVKAFSKMNSKLANLEVTFKLKKSDSPIVQIRFMDASPQSHRTIYEALLRGLDSPNYRVEKAEVKYNKGYRFVYDFSSCEAASIKFHLKEN